MSALFVEWEDFSRLDAEGYDMCLVARIYFKAGGYQRGFPTSWDEPGEAERFEDIEFLRAELDPIYCKGETPLTEAEIAACRAWFETDEAQASAQLAALREYA